MSESETPTPDLIKVPRQGFVPLTNTIQGVLNWCAQVKPGEPLAIDVERASTYRYSSRAYLIQLKSENAGILMLDPLAFKMPNSFIELVNSHPWILHASRQDLPSLAMEGLFPPALFDTEVAARLLGMERVSLGALTEDLLGVRLAKEHSAADWSRRPLPEQWLDYAALDVDFLLELQNILLPALEFSGKRSWAEAEFEFETSYSDLARDPEPWRSTKGIGQLKTPKQLAVLRELWEYRDQIAKSNDIAPFTVIRDKYLVNLAKATLLGKAEFDKAAPRTLRGRDRWWKVARTGRQVSASHLPQLETPEQIPPQKIWSRRYPEVLEAYQGLREQLLKLAETLQMPVENLISPNPVRTWVFEQVTSPELHPSNELVGEAQIEALIQELIQAGARRWQGEQVAKVFQQQFSQHTPKPR